MAAFTAGTPVWNSPAISPAVIHTSLPVTLTLVLYNDYVTFHGVSVLDGTSCKFLDLVQSCGKVLHVLVELLFGYLRVYPVSYTHLKGCIVIIYIVIFLHYLLYIESYMLQGLESGKPYPLAGFLDDAAFQAEQAGFYLVKFIVAVFGGALHFQTCLLYTSSRRTGDRCRMRVGS